MNKRIALLALALAAAPLAASADELGYTYIEGGYQQLDIDDLGEGNGAAINASLAITDKLHVFGGYSRQSEEATGFLGSSFDPVRVEVDINWYRAGLGFNHGFNDRVDLVVRGAYERAHLDVSLHDEFGSFGSGDGKADGWSVEAGVRGLLASRFEGWALAGYADISTVELMSRGVDTDESEDDQAYGRIGAQFKITPVWGVVGEARVSDEFNQYFLGLRASF